MSLLFYPQNHTATLHSEHPAKACVVYNDWRYLIAKIRISENNTKQKSIFFVFTVERKYLKT